jgi:hypothetical protein
VRRVSCAGLVCAGCAAESGGGARVPGWSRPEGDGIMGGLWPWGSGRDWKFRGRRRLRAAGRGGPCRVGHDGRLAAGFVVLPAAPRAGREISGIGCVGCKRLQIRTFRGRS